jgi:phosphoribosyl 1,2-cyclic phosphodiesterase
MHSDHCSWYPLRVLSEAHLPVMLHESHLEQLRRRHCRNGLFKKLNVKTFHSSGFSIGGLRVEPFEVVHQPGFRTFGYKITFKSQNAWKKAVVVSDLNNGLELTDLFTETDFIYLESNHDLELLRLNPNPNSRFHMSNPATARLLADIRRKSKKPPQAVMLGHLSEHRNEADIALGQMHDTFIKEGLDLDFPLVPAPLYAVSETITIN